MTEEKKDFGRSRAIMCRMTERDKMERARDEFFSDLISGRQNFLSYSPWDERALLDQVARDANHLLGSDADSCFIVDESGFGKKGKKSVGVSRQWNGRLGKIDNCQVGVYGALCCRDQVSLIDTRLFLPESWTNDPDRCLEAGVPEDRLEHRKKAELALDMVQSARQNGVDFQWVGGDAFYGDDPEFL